MKKTTIAAMLLIAAGASQAPLLLAQEMTAPGTMNPALIAAGTYTTDPAHTLVEWSVNHLGFTDYFGLFGNIEGTLTLDPAAIDRAKVDIRVPIAQVTVASEELKQHMLRAGKDGAKPDFFGPEPGMAHFVSDTVTPLGSTRALIKGTLTMNGQSHPVVLTARFTGAGTSPMGGAQTVGFAATTTIERSQWGVDYGIPLVSDAVDLKITAAFEKK